MRAFVLPDLSDTKSVVVRTRKNPSFEYQNPKQIEFVSDFVIGNSHFDPNPRFALLGQQIVTFQ